MFNLNQVKSDGLKNNQAYVYNNLENRLEELETLTNRLNVKRKAKVENADILGSMLESCPLPIWVKSKDGTMVFFNKAYADIYDVKPEEYIGKKDSEFWTDEIAQLFTINDKEVLEGGTKYLIEIIPTQSRKRPDTFRDHITVVKWKVEWEGEVIGVAGIVTSVFP